MLDFNVKQIPFEVVIAQQKLVDQLYQAGSMQQIQPANPASVPVQQQTSGGNQ